MTTIDDTASDLAQQHDYELLGTIASCQIHTERMVNDGYYDASLRLPVDELWLSADGVVGVAGRQALLHAHHRLHPNKVRAENPKKFLPNRLLSIGFTGHTRMISERFRPVPPGIAAEDIMVDCDREVDLSELAEGVQIRSSAGAIDLNDAAIAKPCVPFTKFLLDDQDAPDDVVAPNRAFLDGGIRGFIFGLAHLGEPAVLKPGDEVWAKK